MKYDVFISYSRKDYLDEQKNVIPGNVVSQIKEALMAAGITFWFDEEGIYHGQNFIKIITQNIEASRVFLFLSSVNSNQSTWTSREIGIADVRKKHIIPFRIDQSRYNPEVEFRIVNLDYIDYYTNPKKGIAEMVDSIKKYLEQERNQAEWARELQEKNDQIAKLEKELKDAKNQEIPTKPIIQPIRRRIHIAYILLILAVALISLFWIVKERRSNLNLEELLQADEIELAPYRQAQQQEQEEETRRQAEAEAKRKAEAEVRQQKEESKRKAEAGKELQSDKGVEKQAEELFQLGEDYYYGRNGKTQSYEEAVRCYRKSAEQGYAPAQNSLGYMYDIGQGVTKSDEEAVKWYRKAAEQGYARAQSNLGNMYANGQGVPKSDEEAVKWFCKAAEQGNASAQCNLGRMYVNGRGVTKSDEEAVKWFRKANEQGYADAQCCLGYMYENGRGVTKNIEEAVKLYRKAAEQGDEYAQKALERLGK